MIRECAPHVLVGNRPKTRGWGRQDDYEDALGTSGVHRVLCSLLYSDGFIQCLAPIDINLQLRLEGIAPADRASLMSRHR